MEAASSNAGHAGRPEVAQPNAAPCDAHCDAGNSALRSCWNAGRGETGGSALRDGHAAAHAVDAPELQFRAAGPAGYLPPQPFAAPWLDALPPADAAVAAAAMSQPAAVMYRDSVAPGASPRTRHVELDVPASQRRQGMSPSQAEAQSLRRTAVRGVMQVVASHFPYAPATDVTGAIPVATDAFLATLGATVDTEALTEGLTPPGVPSVVLSLPLGPANVALLVSILAPLLPPHPPPPPPSLDYSPRLVPPEPRPTVTTSDSPALAAAEPPIKVQLLLVRPDGGVRLRAVVRCRFGDAAPTWTIRPGEDTSSHPPVTLPAFVELGLARTLVIADDVIPTKGAVDLDRGDPLLVTEHNDSCAPHAHRRLVLGLELSPGVLKPAQEYTASVVVRAPPEPPKPHTSAEPTAKVAPKNSLTGRWNQQPDATRARGSGAGAKHKPSTAPKRPIPSLAQFEPPADDGRSGAHGSCTFVMATDA